MPGQEAEVVISTPASTATPKTKRGATKKVKGAGSSGNSSKSKSSPEAATPKAKSSPMGKRGRKPGNTPPAPAARTLDAWVVRDSPTPAQDRSPLRSLSPDVPIAQEAGRSRPEAPSASPPRDTASTKRSRSNDPDSEHAAECVVEVKGSLPSVPITGGTATATVTPPTVSNPKGRRSSGKKVGMKTAKIVEAPRASTPKPVSEKAPSVSDGVEGERGCEPDSSAATVAVTAKAKKSAEGAARGMDTFTRKGMKASITPPKPKRRDAVASSGKQKKGRGGNNAAVAPNDPAAPAPGPASSLAAAAQPAQKPVAAAAAPAEPVAADTVSTEASASSGARAARRNSASKADAPTQQLTRAAAASNGSASTSAPRTPVSPRRASRLAGSPPPCSPVVPVAPSAPVATVLDSKPASGKAATTATAAPAPKKRGKGKAARGSKVVLDKGPLVTGVGGGSGWKKKGEDDGGSSKGKDAGKREESAAPATVSAESGGRGVGGELTVVATTAVGTEKASDQPSSPGKAEGGGPDEAFGQAGKRSAAEEGETVTVACVGSDSSTGSANTTPSKKQRTAEPSDAASTREAVVAAGAAGESAVAATDERVESKGVQSVEPNKAVTPKKSSKRKSAPLDEEGDAAAATESSTITMNAAGLDSNGSVENNASPAATVAAVATAAKKKMKASPAAAPTPGAVVGNEATPPSDAASTAAIETAATAAVPEAIASSMPDAAPSVVDASATLSPTGVVDGASTSTGAKQAREKITKLAPAGGQGGAAPGDAGGSAAAAPTAAVRKPEEEFETHVMVGDVMQVRCRHCRTRFARAGCSMGSCLDCCFKAGVVCVAHAKQLDRKRLEQELLAAGPTREERRRLAKGVFKEEAIHAIGDTATIWCLMDFICAKSNRGAFKALSRNRRASTGREAPRVSRKTKRSRTAAPAAAASATSSALPPSGGGGASASSGKVRRVRPAVARWRRKNMQMLSALGAFSPPE